MSRFPLVLRWLACSAALWCLVAGPVRAQEESSSDAEEIELPLAIFHCTSVDRLLDHSKLIFAAAGRDDKSSQVEDWIQTSLNDLDGLDRTRPFGIMTYLKPGLAGLSGVAYVPVKNVDALLRTLTGGTGDFRTVEGKRDRYKYTNAFTQSYVALNRSGYLFLVSENDEAELDRNFPAPEQLVSRLNSRYDFAASLQIKSIPPNTRQLFVSFLQTQSMAELQKKDDEPEAAYRVRRANAENVLELIEKIVIQGEELTLGARLDDATNRGELDLEVAGTRDSPLAKFFQGMVGKKSLFANLLEQPSMMTLAVSWQLDEKQRKALTELFSLAPEELDRQAAKENIEGTKSAVTPLFDTLLRSAETGHLDGFLQLAGQSPGAFSLVGGVRVTGGVNFPRQFHEALRFSQDKFSHIDRVAAIELDVERFKGQPIHRLPLTPPDKRGQYMFGEGPHLYAYATTQALWLAFGGDEALSSLKASVEAAGKPGSPTEDRKPRVPFVFQTQARQWVEIRLESGANEPDPNLDLNPNSNLDPKSNPNPNPNPNRRRGQFFNRISQEMESAFDSENDGLRVEVRPTDSGVRMRWEFQPGWISLLGRIIARQMDQPSRAAPPATSVDQEPPADSVSQ